MHKKDVRTNAMRMLDKAGVAYTVNTYECDVFVDAQHVSDLLGQAYDNVLKTLVTLGKSGEAFVFVIPIERELDLKKAARAVGEKSLQMIHVKDLTAVTGYVRGGCSPIGMKKAFVTVVDRAAQGMDSVIISGGRIGSQIELRPQDLIAVTGAKWDDVTQ